MHILVTNDDGPPSAESSPYILPFVQHLEAAGHTVSVAIPDTQRSWIGKAHIVGLDVQASFYWPPASTPDISTSNVSKPNDSKHPWVLLNSTPASCVQIGLSHFFTERGKIDLVVSGPNYGRNTTAVFALSSGTLGAALEATICGHRAIALSFAFVDRNHVPEVVAESCRQGVRVCEYLAKNAGWESARLYSVNIPVQPNVTTSKVVWTKMLQNQWTKGSCFQELPESASVDDAAAEERKLRRQEADVEGKGGTTPPSAWKHRHFKWAPRFADVYDSTLKAGPGSDGWAVKEGQTSITPLLANFMHVEGFAGAVEL